MNFLVNLAIPLSLIIALFSSAMTWGGYLAYCTCGQKQRGDHAEPEHWMASSWGEDIDGEINGLRLVPPLGNDI